MGGARLRTRHVFYIAGFDPRGARHYHHLYKTHALKQSAVNGLGLDVSPRGKTPDGRHVWHVRANDDQGPVDTTVEFLPWDDIVRAQWKPGLRDIAADTWQFLRGYLSGPTAGTAKNAPRQLIAGYYPLLFVLLSCALALWAASAALNGLRPHTGFLPAVAGAVLAGWGTLKLLALLGNRLAVFWLARIYAFCARWARNEIPEIEPRLDAFAARIAAVLQEDTADEVLIVSHSVGAVLAVPVLARLLRRDAPRGKLSVVTLGHCIPLMTFQKKAEAYRADLGAVARDENLFWVDYTAPSDGICFPLLDPAAACGLEGRGPKILSPRFFRLYTPENYARLKYNWFRMHFLYLMSTDHAGDYDYFAMTAGPLSLPARLKGA